MLKDGDKFRPWDTESDRDGISAKLPLPRRGGSDQTAWMGTTPPRRPFDGPPKVDPPDTLAPVLANRLIPAAAGGLAALVLAGAIWPEALLAATVLAPPAAAALVLVRRRHRGLAAVITAIALWLAGGIGGAVMLASRPRAGFAWIVVVLFVIPLPLLPWLYARTFAQAPNGPKSSADA